ncbi:MAG: amidohydrolase [Acidisphaera sp.]|nr:amidohydrolase [Acidisphaera sp.]MBV9811804.1 amidohydrolase [Acetobacteraceae bacterium]
MAESWNRYGPTVARRRTDRAGLKPRGPVVDFHSHVWVSEAAEFVRPHLPARADGQTAPETLELSRRQESERRSRMLDIEQRLAEVDAMGVEVQVIKPAPGQCYHALDPAVGAEAARLVNNGIAAFAARRPDRFVPFGTVPMQDGRLAAAELTRCARELGLKGVQVLTNIAGKEVSDPDLEPFWSAAEASGTFVVLHPSGFTEPRRFGRFYFGNVIGNPLDTTMALHHLIFDGVLERHPGLRILAVHGGGYLPGYIGRMDHAWGARSDARGTLPQPPSSYLKRVYVDSVVFTPEQLENLVRVFGADHVLMGTDYPYDMAEYEPLDHLASARGLGQAEVDAIGGRNAAALLGL